MTVKAIVLYPTPADVDAFESAYTHDHVPLVTAESFPGIRKFVASRVVGTIDGSPAPFYRIAELHFASMDALKAAASAPGAQAAVGHAFSISSGGRPVLLVAEEDTKTFG